MKATTGSTQNGQDGMKQLRMAMALVLGLATLPALAQTADPEDRFCTAGFNQDYGWFLTDEDDYGVLEFPGDLSSSCVPVTTAKLAAQLGGLTLPLSREVIYDLGANPSKVTLPLLEPALCEDYFTGSGGEAVWNLVVLDANGEPLFSTGAGAVKGVASLGYNLTTGALTPAMVSSYGNTPWLRCHSGLAPNAEITLPGGSEGHPLTLFADGYESPVYASDLQLQFLDPDTDELLTQDVMYQPNTGNIRFKVRVANVGNMDATDVRVREFLPSEPPPATPVGPEATPVVERVACVDHGPTGTGTASCNNGIGGDRFAADISSLAPGEERDFTLTRRSTGTDLNDDQVQALIQIAAFSSPVDALDANYQDNSRSLRILVVDQISVSHGHTTNGVTGGSGGSIVISSVPVGVECTTTGQTTTCPPGTTGLVFDADAASGYTFTGFSGSCVGTPSDEPPLPGGGTFTTTTASSCTVTANFREMPIVTATAGANGSISPDSQQIHHGEYAEFTITPDFGHQVALPIAGCGGVAYDASAAKWKTTSPVTADCDVVVAFEAKQSVVTVMAGPNGTITSQNPFSVEYPDSEVVFIVKPDPTYEVQIASSSTCQNIVGPLSIPLSSSVMIGANGVYEDCQIDVIFSQITHQVTISSMNNGTLVLDNGGIVTHGDDAQFTVQPQIGYHLDGEVSGTSACGTVSDDGQTGTAGPITSSGCELSANFAINQYTVTVSIAEGSEQYGTIGEQGASTGDVVPVVIDPVVHGTSAEFWTFASAGYFAEVVPQPGCNFIFSGIDSLTGAVKFRASQVSASCNLEVEFLPD